MTTNLKYESFVADSEPSPQIYVVCLASEAIGKLHATWVDATLEVEELLAAIKQFIASGPVPDGAAFSIRDYKGFYSLEMGKQHEFLEDIRGKAEFIRLEGELGAALLAYYEGDLSAAEEAIINNYKTWYEDELDFATRLFNRSYFNSVQVPESVGKYINYPQFQKDIFEREYFSITV